MPSFLQAFFDRVASVKANRIPALCLLTLLLSAFGLRAQVPAVMTDPLEFDAGPVKGAELDKAQFRWWAPADAKNLSGVLVLIPGRNGDGRAMANDPQWQELATSLNLGLVACFFYGEKEYFKYQSDPTGDVARTINEAVEKLASQNGHPGLKKPPLVLWGHSAGACVSEVYASRFPERVAAAVNLKGPRGAGGLVTGKDDIPFLIIVGKNDKAEWVKSATESFEAAQAKNAVWTLALQANEGHEGGKSQELIATFLRSVVPQRIGSGAIGSSTAGRPKRLVKTQGWLGDPETFEVASNTNFKGKKKAAIWLPDETTALAWQAFLKP